MGSDSNVTEHNALVPLLISPKHSLYGDESTPVPADNDVVTQIQNPSEPFVLKI